MGGFRAALARTRRVWLLLAGLLLLAWTYDVATTAWWDNDESVVDAWLYFFVWTVALAVVTAAAYESVRPVTPNRARDRAWAGLVYGLIALPLLVFGAFATYAATRPEGLSLDLEAGSAFFALLVPVIAPTLASTILAAGFFLSTADVAWKRMIYWVGVALVFLLPYVNTSVSAGFLYHKGGGLLATGLALVLAPVYVRFWRWRPRRAKPEPLYPVWDPKRETEGPARPHRAR